MMDFSRYTRKNIQDAMLSQVPDTLDKRQGSVIQTAVGPAAWYLEGTYMTLAQIQENAFATTAVGEFLDLVVQERGITRRPPRRQYARGYLMPRFRREASLKR